MEKNCTVLFYDNSFKISDNKGYTRCSLTLSGYNTADRLLVFIKSINKLIL